MQATKTLPLTITDSNTTVIGPGPFVFEELHVHEGKTLVILPGAELIRQDVPPANPAHGDGGIVAHGKIIAVRGPNDPPILIRSENPNGHRGHLMMHGQAEIDGVEIRDFGRTTNLPISATNPLARYAVHWHLAGDASRGAFIKNCLVHDTASPKSNRRFGIVVHGSNGVTVQGNTVRNKCGSGIYLEDGTEVDNVIDGNLVEDIWDKNLNDWQTFPIRPDAVESGMAGNGYYFKHPRNVVKNNMARRCGYGYQYFPRASSPPAAPQLYGLDFVDNVAEFCHKGLEFWEIGGPAQDSVVTRFAARDCKMGLYPYPAWRILIDSPTLLRCVTGMIGTDYQQRGFTVRDASVIDCDVGVSALKWADGGWLVEGGLFRCTTNIEVKQMTLSSAFASTIQPRVTTIRGVRHEARPGRPLRAIVLSVLDGWSFRTLNLTISDKVFVEDHNGVAGDNFRVYWNPEQTANYVLPVSSLPRFIASPGPAPMTNSDAWAQYGKAFHGEIVPAGAGTRTGIVGLVV